MAKQIFTKKQAVAVLSQIDKNQELDLFADVETTSEYFKLSCEQLESALLKFLRADSVAGVVAQGGE